MHNNINLDKDFAVTVQEFATLMKISNTVAYELTNTPGFPVIKMGRKKIIPMSLLKEWLKENIGKTFEGE